MDAHGTVNKASKMVKGTKGRELESESEWMIECTMVGTLLLRICIMFGGTPSTSDLGVCKDARARAAAVKLKFQR
jgi:hypothetical protein